MAWIQSSDDIWDHHKTINLQAALGISAVQAVGHLTSLWHFVLRNAWSDADLKKWGDAGIERAARWEGKPGAMVKALRDCGFLDRSVAHGWMERAGKLVADRIYNDEKRKSTTRKLKNASLRRNTAKNASLRRITAKNAENRSLDKIREDKIREDKIREDKIIRVSVIPPTIEAVKAYCAERGKGIDPETFHHYYEARGWMMGKTKMKSWKAAVHTWEKNQNGINRNNNGSGNQRIVGDAAPVPGKYDHLG